MSDAPAPPFGSLEGLLKRMAECWRSLAPPLTVAAISRDRIYSSEED